MESVITVSLCYLTKEGLVAINNNRCKQSNRPRRWNMVKKVMIILAVAGLLGLTYQAWAATWTVEPVTNAPENESYPFIAKDNLNILHVTFVRMEAADAEVFYASNNAGPWQVSRVTDNSNDDWCSDILFEPVGKVHIAIRGNDGSDEDIYHASGMPGSWAIERVTDDNKNDIYPQIAIDAQGFLHMAYHKVDPSGTDYEIFYANNKPGHWVEEQVTFNTVEDVGVSLALDKLGNPHIAFWRGTPPNLSVRYTRKIAGVWDEQMVASPQTQLPSLVLDKNDFAHIAYAKFDGADYEIYYANNVTGTWQEGQVTSNTTNDLYNSIVLDDEGKVHIAYMGNDGDNEVYYADNTAGVWQTGRVTDNTIPDNFWGSHAFVIDGLGFGHIVFWNGAAGNDDIYHAKSDAPIAVGVEESSRQPVRAHLVLNPNFPDPFHKTTALDYELPAPGFVTITIYDASGQLVRTLLDEYKPAGTFKTVWDGRSTQGNPVTTGVYFCKLNYNGASLTEKLVVVR